MCFQIHFRYFFDESIPIKLDKARGVCYNGDVRYVKVRTCYFKRQRGSNMKFKIRIAALLVAIALLTTLASSCGIVGGGSAELSSVEVYKKTSGSIVCVLMERTGLAVNGTGFFVNDSGAVLTAYHVVKNGGDGRVQLSNLNTYEVTSIIAYNAELDLALIQTEATNTSPLKFSNSASAKMGETVYTIGYPRAYDLGTSSPTFTSGMISARRTHSGVEYIQSTVDATDGNSGGPLINSHGEVVGVITSSIDIDGVCYMTLSLPSDTVSSFVSSNIAK